MTGVQTCALPIFSMVVSNLGLSHLIQLSIPVLTAIYPPCIVLVLLSFTVRWWNKSARIVAPAMLISLLFGIVDAVKGSEFKDLLPGFCQNLPLADQGLSWLPPTLVIVLVCVIIDRVKGSQQVEVRQ